MSLSHLAATFVVFGGPVVRSPDPSSIRFGHEAVDVIYATIADSGESTSTPPPARQECEPEACLISDQWHCRVAGCDPFIASSAFVAAVVAAVGFAQGNPGKQGICEPQAPSLDEPTGPAIFQESMEPGLLVLAQRGAPWVKVFVISSVDRDRWVCLAQKRGTGRTCERQFI